MIPNITKGADMGGLLRYLVGPGRANEHTNPHVVGGDGFVVAWHGSESLDGAAAREIAGYLDEPRLAYGTTMTTRVTAQDPETGEKVVMGSREVNVWHCSLSLRAEEGALSDEQWQAITSEFMQEMGFTEASGKPPARWVAIHHGVSSNGNDHVHIAASMIRENGTKWEGRYGDYARSQQVCRALEAKYGLERVDAGVVSAPTRGERPAERRQAAEAGRVVTAPVDMAGRVRATAVASLSEAEWVRRMRGEGLVVKPFFAKGSTSEVAGYRVSLPPAENGGKWAFRAGGKLAADLSLPRLRETWPTPTEADNAAARAEWVAAFKGQPVVAPGREAEGLEGMRVGVETVKWDRYNRDLLLAQAEEAARWGEVAREAAGVASAWAMRDPQAAPELRQAAAVLGRSAGVRRRTVGAGQRVTASPSGTAALILAAAPGNRGRIAGPMLIRQLRRTAQALAGYAQATGDLRQAEALRRDVAEKLAKINTIGHLPEQRPTFRDVQAATEGGEVDPREADYYAHHSPVRQQVLPNQLPERAAVQHTTTHEKESGYER